jgi:hypothetical protein
MNADGNNDETEKVRDEECLDTKKNKQEGDFKSIHWDGDRWNPSRE